MYIILEIGQQMLSFKSGNQVLKIQFPDMFTIPIPTRQNDH